MHRRFFWSAALAALALTAACKDSSGPTTANAMPIASGVPVTGISGNENSSRYYRITVPPGSTRLLVETEGGSGDVDLLIRRNRLPSLLESDCESFEVTNDDGCDISNPGAGDWYIMLFGSEQYAGVTLSATVTTP